MSVSTMSDHLSIWFVSLLISFSPSVLWAAAPAPTCASLRGPKEVVGCALAQSLDLRIATQELRALAGRRRAAGTLLPSHPIAALTLAERRPMSGGVEGTAPVLNWYVSLSQEIELAGQRGARIDVADAATAAQIRRVAIAEQEAAAAALTAYYDLLGAKEELRRALATAEVAAALSALSAARARETLLPPVDATVARAEAARITVSRFEAERRHGAALAVLLSVLGLERTMEVTGTLEHLPAAPTAVDVEAQVASALTVRGEVAAAEMERRMQLARVRLLHRERLPNLTLSFLAQRDGFDERVLSGGLSLPLLLPAPLGPSRAGEIQAAQAEVAQAETTIEKVRRQVRMEVVRAWQGEQAYDAELRLFPAELIQQTEASLSAIARAAAARQLPLRDALLSQRSLIELLLAYGRTRLGFALARVERLRAAGLPLAGGAL